MNKCPICLKERNCSKLEGEFLQICGEKMRKRAICLAIAAVLSFSFIAWQHESFRANTKNRFDESGKLTFAEILPQSREAEKFAVSAPLNSLAASERNSRDFKTAKVFSLGNSSKPQTPILDANAENPVNNLIAAPMPTPSLTFEGIKNRDNFDVFGFAFIPPDANGDVGANHYVQAVNSLIRVYDKNTGNPLAPAFPLSQIFAPLNTPCATRNDGQPTVLYDSLADRWLISQYCTLAPPFRQMIAVSQTGNPLGSYNLYEFVMPNNKLNDYTKFGVWRDGYYMTSEEFVGSDFSGTGIFAFDREKMLVGDRTATYVYVDLLSTSNVRLGSFLPADFDGLTPSPTDAPAIFASYSANEYGDARDALRLFEFRPNFFRPSSATFTERAESPISVAGFDPTSPPDRADILQPAPGEALDSQSDRLMYRLAYRNFGTFDSLVLNQTVRVSAPNEQYRAGVRFYELRRTLPQTSPFTVQNQATIAPNDGLSRWMGSAAQDKDGNLAVGYSASSGDKVPSIAYTGRLATDAPNTFREEASLINGSGVQTAFGFRWGDYTSMSVDALDGCSFYYTNEYYTAESQAESPFAWLTRIGKFRFPSCADQPKGTISARVFNSVTNQPIPNAILRTADGYSRQSNANGVFDQLNVVPNSYSLTVSANGYRQQTQQISVINGANATQDFFLQPVALIQPQSIEFTAESCNRDSAFEPNETVTINFPIRNTGAIAANNVTVTLQPNTGILNPSGAQNYGTIEPNATVSRSFTFTVAPNVACGSFVLLSFDLQYSFGGGATAAAFLINRSVGRTKYALREQFNGATLPNGWTTAASGGQQIWRTALIDQSQNNYAAFGPEGIQPGVNELVSPIFRVTTPNARLSFRNKYNLETTFLRNRLYDGAVLEIKIGNGEFQDILAAGGSFASGGYVGTIDSCCQNPLAGRLGWSGKSGTDQTTANFVPTDVVLPASSANQDIQLRWRVGTDIGSTAEGQYIDDIEIPDGYECSCNLTTRRAPFDFDGDGKTDLSVFRPGSGVWFVQKSSDNSVLIRNWGLSSDKIAPADFDGDGKADLAVFRPNDGTWYVQRSADNAVTIQRFGVNGDVPQPFDFDGDGKADFAVFRPSNGTWYVQRSSDSAVRVVQFGANGDSAVANDFDGDGKADFGVFRPSNGVWYVQRSSDGGATVFNFGTNGDKPVSADFDGDGKADFGVFRPSNRTWYIWQSATGNVRIFEFGVSSDIPAVGDFDGDGKADVAVYRPSNGIWYLQRSTNGFFAQQFGISEDLPAPSAFVP